MSKKSLMVWLLLAVFVFAFAAVAGASEPKVEKSENETTEMKSDEHAGHEHATEAAAESDAALSTPEKKMGYLLGFDIGSNLSRAGAAESLDLEALTMGMKEGLAGKDSRLSEEESMKLMQDFQMSIQKKMREKQEAAAVDNAKEGEEFLAKNKSAEGVITTDSGLQYKITSKGDGPSPKEGDTVKVHYRGTLLDGTEFDSSYKRGQPASFTIAPGRLIQGWVEGIPLLNTGSKATFWIPAELAYGANPPSPDIGPNSMLIFDIELLDVESPKAETE